MKPLFALLPVLALALVGVTPSSQQVNVRPSRAPQPFRVLDNVEGDDIDLLNYPIEPMVMNPAHSVLWAVNTHGSEVLRFSTLSGAPSGVFPVPWNPVSLEYWVSSVDSHHELLVVSRGTYGLTRLDPTDGTILGFVSLPAEPGGTLLVGDHLFVACSAVDQVVQVDLVTGAIFQTFEIDTTRHLLFLSPDGLGNVLVTPLLSGNNTMARRTSVAGSLSSDRNGNVLDMANPMHADIPLPDEDVFRIRPGLTPGSGTVEVVATGVGTVLFAHGLNPATGQLWVLNTEANNADVELDSEPELLGVFSENRLTVVDLPAPGAPPATAHAYLSLDEAPPAPLAKPFGLTFASDGRALVAGTSTDNVGIFSSGGAHLFSWNLPAGSIPRAVLFDEVLDLIFVYCWGTNLIEVRNASLAKVVDLDLGHDPTSTLRKEGRRLFYDAKNSLNGSVSCETCHVEGMFDHLVWNLSGTPQDDKGVLFTQSLKGIEFTGPYHWRGERQLFDFNGAFAGLLGGTELTTQQFGAFEEFLFGLQNPANPFEHPDRVLSDDKVERGFSFPTHVNLSAARGQALYFSEPSVGNDSCNDCHTLPTGTNNDFFPDGMDDLAHRSTFVNTAFNGLWRKEQKTRVLVKERFRQAEMRPPLGSGSSHAGLSNGVFEFNVEEFDLAERDKEDIAFFVHQLDSGLAPAVHRAVLLSPQHTDPEATGLSYLIAQAQARNCDIAVIGRADVGSGVQSLRWFWNRSQHAFVSEDSSLAPRPVSFFVDQALAGTGTNLFVGLPVGMGRRFAVDPDNDLLFARDEQVHGTNPRDPDSDGDGFLDGTEVLFGSDALSDLDQPSTPQGPTITRVKKLFHTARVAKLLVEIDRPVHLQVSFSSNLGDVGTFSEDAEYKTIWEVALRNLQPSNAGMGIHRLYSGTITATDEFGHQALVPLPPFETLSFTDAMEFGVSTPLEFETVLRDLTLVSVQPAVAGGWEFVYSARVENRKLQEPAPLAGHVVTARVIRNGEIETDIDVNGAPPAQAIGSLFGHVDLYGGFGGSGPFVVGSISGADGLSTLTFRLPSAASGDGVQLSVEMVGRPVDSGSFDPENPLFDDSSLFDLPNTATEYRASDVVVLP